MKMKHFQSGPMENNTYVLYSEGEGVVIDPSFDVSRVLDFIEENGLSIKFILNTHGHFDHIMGNEEVHEATGCKVCIGKEDSVMLEEGLHGGSGWSIKIPTMTPDRELVDGDEIKVGGEKIKCIHTPGHSPGGMCFLVGEMLFTGDTLFKRAVGRYDLRGADKEDLFNSIKDKLYVLPDDTKVYPGHSEFTTIGEEKEHNPYVKA